MPSKAELAAPADVAAPPADAKKTSSGLAYKVLKPGSGTTHPRATDTVEVHYSGWTTDGKLFDSSVARGEPASFPLNGVIAGWTEGLQLMVAGEKARFWIPAKLAYGDRPRGGAPAGTLVFDVELLSIG
jgi:FKBP-type peptidyl-prolyl cis-trans isomerase